MVKLRSFSKSEDAHLAAALLGSEGLEVTVNDESSFGGNLLGATANAITIEVQESDLDKAKRILAENEKKQPDLPDAAESTESTVRTWYFDTLVICELILIAVEFLFPDHLYEQPPEAVQTFLNQLVSVDLWRIVDGVSGAYLILMVVSSVLLYCRMKIGRFLYVGTLIWAVVTNYGYPPGINTSFGSSLFFLHNLLGGVILAMMFLKPVSREFRKRLTS